MIFVRYKQRSFIQGVWEIKQQTLAANGFEAYRKTISRGKFLSRKDTLLPWAEFCAVTEPHYPKAGDGRRPVGLERMLRMYFIATWFNLADVACEDALYDVLAFRDFCQFDPGRECVPDATTLLNFRHPLERYDP